MNKRDAINEVLLNLNELPLDVDDLVADIQIATIVDEQIDISTKKILGYGWSFNTLTQTFFPNIERKIVIPSTVLSLVGTTNKSLVVKDHKLFDKSTLSFNFDDGQEVEYYEEIAFDDIPFHVANFIVATASLTAYINIIGNTGDIAVRREELKEAKILAVREDANSIKGNFIDDDADLSDLLERS